MNNPKRPVSEITIVNRDLVTDKTETSIAKVVNSGCFNYIALKVSPEILIKINNDDLKNALINEGDKVKISLIDKDKGIWSINFISDPIITPKKKSASRPNSPSGRISELDQLENILEVISTEPKPFPFK